MCLSYRHDYGLRKNKDDPTWTAGMTEEDAKMLYKIMENLYTNDIQPHLQEFKNAFDESQRNNKS